MLSYPLIIASLICIKILLEIPGIYQTLKECDTPDTIWNIFKAGLELHIFHGLTTIRELVFTAIIWTITLFFAAIKFGCIL